MDNYWYMTSLCFPMGYMAGKYKDKFISGLKSLPFLIISGGLFFATFIGYRVFGGTVLQITYFLFLVITVTALLFCFGMSSKVLAFVGTHSVYVYLIHIGLAMPCYNQISNIWIATGAYAILTAVGSVICNLISGPLNGFISDRLEKSNKKAES